MRMYGNLSAYQDVHDLYILKYVRTVYSLHTT